MGLVIIIKAASEPRSGPGTPDSPQLPTPVHSLHLLAGKYKTGRDLLEYQVGCFSNCILGALEPRTRASGSILGRVLGA